MFTEFFYLLRAGGLKVSINEWMTLCEAVSMGLANSSLTGFYNLCRSILVKTESDFDKLDACFAAYFAGIVQDEDLADKFWQWLAESEIERDLEDKTWPDEKKKKDLEELMRMFEERKKQQNEAHDKGSFWIGTGGTSVMGRGGYNQQGIRTGGYSRHRSAVQIAGERKFRDFREDNNITDIRQFQMAFRKLRQYSVRMDDTEKELSIDKTIDETCNNGGLLTLEYEKPRKNTVKVLLLMDSDGSMITYTSICNQLFQALTKSNHFKDLQTYYFHNCIYDHVYTTPECRRGQWIDTEFLFRKLNSEYKVIFVGDAAMAPMELMNRGGNIEYSDYNEEPGIIWLSKFKKHFKKQIWLNPMSRAAWDLAYGSYTVKQIRKIFPMYELNIDGLEKGIKRLLVRQ